jgi:flagellar biosynthetic protein FliR
VLLAAVIITPGLIFGLFAIWVLHANFLPHFEVYTRQTFDFMRELQQ